MIKIEIKNLLKDGLKEINFSKYPFGIVREALEELGYTLGECVDGKYQELYDWVNGWELDYAADIFMNNKPTMYTIVGSFWFGTCQIVKYELYN